MCVIVSAATGIEPGVAAVVVVQLRTLVDSLPELGQGLWNFTMTKPDNHGIMVKKMDMHSVLHSILLFELTFRLASRCENTVSSCGITLTTNLVVWVPFQLCRF